jgi:hypothetical protein
MLSQRAVLGAARRLPTQIRQPVQRRWASSTQEFTGAQNNAFNRERAAVKAHAGESAGAYRRSLHMDNSLTSEQSSGASSPCSRSLPTMSTDSTTQMPISLQLLVKSKANMIQRRHPLLDHLRRQRLHTLERTLGTREAPPATRRTPTVRLP